MLPDNPLMVSVLALVLVTHKLLQSNQTKYWLLLGLFVGLAALSKYTAVTIIASLVLILLVELKWQSLTSKGLWLATIIALIMIIPILYWNAIHDWASFIYQIDHGTRLSDWRLSRLLQTQAIQLVSLAWVLLIPIIVQFLWQIRFKRWVQIVSGLHIVLMGPLVLVAHSLLFSPWIPFLIIKIRFRTIIAGQRWRQQP